MGILFDDDRIVINVFRKDNINDKDVFDFIEEKYKPYFYNECVKMNYDYKKDKNVKVKIFTYKYKNSYFVKFIAFDEKIEKALKNNNINITDAVMQEYKCDLEIW